MTRNIIFKSLYKIGLARFLRNSKSEYITVLNLHRITEERDEFYNPILPKTFYRILEYCCRHYEIISFGSIEEPTLKPKLILSFDDGYYDFIEYVLPHLKKLGLPCNHNVVNFCINENEPIWTHRLNEIFKTFKKSNNFSDEILIEITKNEKQLNIAYFKVFKYLLGINKIQRDKILDLWSTKYEVKLKSRMMSWDDIIYCSNNGVEIGSHTYYHSSLKNEVNEDILKLEIFDSIQEISSIINKEINILALPNGQYNDSVLDYANACKIKYVLFSDDQINSISNVSKNNNKISRIGLSDVSPFENILKIELFHSKLKSLLGQ